MRVRILIKKFNCYSLMLCASKMFKRTATDLSTASPQIVNEWLNSFDTVLSDCDGVQWMGETLIEGSRDATRRLQELGKAVYFVTNSPIKTRSDLSRNVASRGYNISKENIISSAYVVAKYLHDQHFQKKVYLMGSTGISKEFDEVGIKYIDADREEPNKSSLYEIIAKGIELDPDVGAVVLGFDVTFTYLKLLTASNYLKNRNCLFIATCYDVVYPTRNGCVVPAVGPLISAIEMASGRKASVFGKPDPLMCKTLIETGKINPGRTLMVGDSARYDILLGTNCGFQTLLVGSGLNNIDEVRIWQKSSNADDKKLVPDVYLPKLGDLMKLLK